MSRAKECETLLLSLVKRSWRKKKAIIKQRRKKSERIIKEEWTKERERKERKLRIKREREREGGRNKEISQRSGAELQSARQTYKCAYRREVHIYIHRMWLSALSHANFFGFSNKLIIGIKKSAFAKRNSNLWRGRECVQVGQKEEAHDDDYHRRNQGRRFFYCFKQEQMNIRNCRYTYEVRYEYINNS